eukprot:m.126169 g.126169  ORF g.126169 m.126169 type:complete len:72 (+) comp12989_c0_seq3:2735-2950(+)
MYVCILFDRLQAHAVANNKHNQTKTKKSFTASEHESEQTTLQFFVEETIIILFCGFLIKSGARTAVLPSCL